MSRRWLLRPTWIQGTPRGYGNSKIAGAWLEEIARAIESAGVLPACGGAGAMVAVSLDFKLNPRSKAYRGQNLPHGTDLDNLVKQTIDGLVSTRGGKLPSGCRLIANDSSIYSIHATKTHVSSDAEMGATVSIEIIESAERDKMEG